MVSTTWMAPRTLKGTWSLNHCIFSWTCLRLHPSFWLQNELQHWLLRGFFQVPDWAGPKTGCGDWAKVGRAVCKIPAGCQNLMIVGQLIQFPPLEIGRECKQIFCQDQTGEVHYDKVCALHSKWGWFLTVQFFRATETANIILKQVSLIHSTKSQPIFCSCLWRLTRAAVTL